MTQEALYLEAARKIAEGEEKYSCYAIMNGITYEPCLPPWEIESLRKYCEIFGPRGRYHGFVSKIINATNNNPKKMTNLRVLLLTLMAACWKDFK